MAKKPTKKTPPVKSGEKTVTPVFKPVFMVLYLDGNPVEKVQMNSQAELDEFNKTSQESYADEIQVLTEEEFDKIVIDDKPTEIVLDETPEVEFKEDELPSQLNVESKKSGIRFTVSKRYFLANRGELKLV